MEKLVDLGPGYARVIGGKAVWRRGERYVVEERSSCTFDEALAAVSTD